MGIIKVVRSQHAQLQPGDGLSAPPAGGLPQLQERKPSQDPGRVRTGPQALLRNPEEQDQHQKPQEVQNPTSFQLVLKY